MAYLLPVKEVIKSLQLLFGFWHITSRSPTTASLLRVHNLKTDSFSCRHKTQVNHLSALKKTGFDIQNSTVLVSSSFLV